MKFQLHLISVCFFLFANRAAGQVDVHIKITQTSSYCGGAAPSNEMLEQLNTPVPFAGKIIYLRKGNTNKLCKKAVVLKSDENGEITALLQPGIYAVVDETKKDKTFYNDLRKRFKNPVPNYEALDVACLDDWLKTPDQVIEVSSEQRLKIIQLLSQNSFIHLLTYTYY